MAEDKAQKTEPATPKRREDARRKGQVAQSRELQSVVVLAAALAALASPVGEGIVEALLLTMSGAFTAVASPPSTTGDFHAALLAPLAAVGVAMVPVLIAILFFGAGAQVAQSGPLWSPQALAPKLERISLVQGFKRFVSVDRLFELVKALIKVGVVAAVAVFVLQDDVRLVVGLAGADLGSGIQVTFDLARQLALAIVLLLAVLAVLDLAYQRWRYEEKLKMSRQEVRDELRQREGDPNLRGRARALHRDMSRSRMIAAVADAHVVVTNPTHYAVALRYDRGSMSAPECVAKGRGHVAARIRAAAVEHDVPIVENPPVARLLHKTCEVGRAIPENLFEAVAEILAFVFRLDPRRARSFGVAS